MIRTKLVSAIALSVCVVALAASAIAQGRYANVYSRGDVDNFIQDLENSSDVFSRDFKSAGGTNSGERRTVDRFENAVDRLRQRFESSDGWWESRNHVQGIMTEARQVNGIMNNARYARQLERQWRDLRRDINKLADTYELPGLGGQGGGYNGGDYGGGYGGRGGGNVPSWAAGTFYGRDRQTGSVVTLTIVRNGSVTVSVDGNQPSYASLNGTTLTNGPYVSRVTRRNNGIRTTDVNDSGNYIDYSRNANGGGGWNPGGGNTGGWNPGGNTGGWNPDGGQGNIPTWAVGTFYGSDPATGSQVHLTINRDGSVSISVDGAQPTFASMNGSTLSNGPYVSRVTRINNGIRTIDVNNSSRYIDYYRR